MGSVLHFLIVATIANTLVPTADYSTADFDKAYVSDACTRLLMHFDDGKLPPADSSDFKNDSMTIGGAVIKDDGKFGKAIYMDGDWDFVRFEDDGSLSPGDQITFEAWLKPLAIDGIREILSKPIMKPPWNQYHLEIRDGKVIAAVSTASKHLSVRSDHAIAVGEWTHTAGAYDGKTLRLYVNGIVQSQTTSGQGPLVDSGEPLTIGVWGGSNYFFKGFIDEVRISSVDRFNSSPVQNENATKIVTKKAKCRPVIDGKMDSSAEEWSEAVKLSGFLRTTDKQPTQQPQPVVFITFDQENLYIAFVSPFEGTLKTDVTAHDGPVWRDDAFEIILDPRRTKSIVYQFALNARGTRYEGYVKQKSWNGKWESKTSVHATEWVGEVAIPFSTFGLPAPYDGETWGINVCRDYGNPKEYTSVAGAAAFLDAASLIDLVFTGGSRETELLPSSFRFNWRVSGADKKQLETEIDVSGVSPAQREKVTVDVALKNADGKAVLTESIKGFSRLHGTTLMDVSGIKPGTYQLNVTLRDGHNRLVDTKTTEFIKPDTRRWLGNTIGIDEDVPPPWTPLEVTGDTISCWNREYQFDGTPFPSRISVGRESILASPIRLTGKVAGKELVWSKGALTFTEKKGHKIVCSLENRHSAMMLRSTIAVEFDGMIRVDLTVSPNGTSPTDVDELYLEIPLKAACATSKYILTYPTGNFYNPNILGTVEDNWRGQFSPQVWLGNEEMGLAWFTESDRGWDLNKHDKALEIHRNREKVVLRVNLIDHRIELKRPLSLTFGLQATPAKPLPSDWQECRVSCYLNTESSILIDWSHPWKEKWFAFPAVQDMIKRGDKYLSYEELIAKYKSDVPQYVPYINIDCASVGVPEFRFYQEQWRAGGPVEGTTGTMTSDVAAFGHALLGVCTTSSWSDFFLYSLNEFLNKYAIDGVYIDNSGVGTCTNPGHSCAFKRDGKIRGTVNIFATRELQKRLYKIVKAKNKNNVIIAHSAGAVVMPLASFYDAHVDGERYYRISDYIGTIPLDKFRTECNTTKWGLVSILDPQMHKPELREDSRSTENVIALTRIHGSLLWPGMANCDTKTVVKLRRLEGAFGMGGTQFLPYWNNQDVVMTSSDNVKVTIFAKEGKLLLYASNLADRATDVQIDLALDKLGLTSDRPTVTDLWNDKELAMSSGTIKIFIKDKNFRMLEISQP